MNTMTHSSTHSTILLDQMVADYKYILETIQRIKKIFDSLDDDNEFLSAKELLIVLQYKLVNYFNIEENYGLLQKLASKVFHLEHNIQAFFKEHQLLIKGVRDLNEKFRELEEKSDLSLLKNLKDDFSDFCSKMKAHEKKEYSLIYDAYQLDLGGGD